MQIQSTDALDRRILSLLQEDGRLSITGLADRIGLSEAPTWRRVKRLEEAGLIAGYHAQVDRKMLGLDVHAIVSVRFSSHELEVSRRFLETVDSLDEVLSCHNVTGDVDYILDVVTGNLEAYERFTQKLRAVPGVVSIQTHLSLREIKSSHRLPIPA